MRIHLAGLLVLCAACGSEPARQPATEPKLPEPSGPPVVQQAEPDAAPARPAGEWKAEGSALRIENADGSLSLSLACTGSPAKLVVTVPSFSPIGSEDRFALALGQEPVTLVADPARQRPGGGVTAEGPAPAEFAALLAGAGQVGALYGTQQVGPHPAPSRDLAAALAAACRT